MQSESALRNVASTLGRSSSRSMQWTRFPLGVVRKRGRSDSQFCAPSERARQVSWCDRLDAQPIPGKMWIGELKSLQSRAFYHLLLVGDRERPR